jgi:hypothetical protein
MAPSDRAIGPTIGRPLEWAVAKSEFSAARPNFDSVCSTGMSDQQRVLAGANGRRRVEAKKVRGLDPGTA